MLPFVTRERSFAVRIIHAKIMPMDAPVIEDGYVDIAGGRIAALGPMTSAGQTDEKDILDAAGALLLPALLMPIPIWVCGRTASGLKGTTATRTPIRPRRTCVRSMRSIRSTAALPKRHRPV